MAKRIHILDRRIAIANLFLDRTLPRRPTRLNVIAERVGIQPRKAHNDMLFLNFAVTKVRNNISYKRKVYSPRLWLKPDEIIIPKRSGPLTLRIADLYERGVVIGKANPAELERLTGATRDSVVWSLKALGFRRGKARQLLETRTEWETVTPPPQFAPLFMRQRELRRSGVNANAIITITEVAAKVDGLIREAVGALDRAGVPLYERGALKKKVQEIVESIFYERSERDAPLGRKEQASRVNWAEIAEFSDVELRQFVKIAARMTEDDDPAGYASRWVRELSQSVERYRATCP